LLQGDAPRRFDRVDIDFCDFHNALLILARQEN